ncbi:hypothetical protein Br6_04799 [Rhodococcus sp. Br-6]|nr:hypothetical protein Br6_04799 [Rhodococcus sp. Br-6]
MAIDWYEPAHASWRIPLLFDEAPDGVPPALAVAFRAVGADLQCLRYGREIRVERLVWTAKVYDDVPGGWPGEWAFGLDSDGKTGVGGMGAGSHQAPLDDAAAVTVRVAEGIQDYLAGYEFVQWPSSGGPLLAPTVRAGLAAWIDPRTDRMVSRIGALCQAGSWS